jgi:hypothetical protein
MGILLHGKFFASWSKRVLHSVASSKRVQFIKLKMKSRISHGYQLQLKPCLTSCIYNLYLKAVNSSIQTIKYKFPWRMPWLSGSLPPGK